MTDESSSNVNVCIEMVDGELERDVVIELTTISLICKYSLLILCI